MVSKDDIKEIEFRTENVSEAINNLVHALEDVGFRKNGSKSAIKVSNSVDYNGMDLLDSVEKWVREQKEKISKK